MSAAQRKDVSKFNVSLEAPRFVSCNLAALLGEEEYNTVDQGGKITKDISVLFCDIRGYTTLCEQLGIEQAFDWIDRFIEHIQVPIKKHRGVIDKYVGDSIMAFFLSSDSAIHASQEILLSLQSFNEQHDINHASIDVGIGVSTGSAVLGPVASDAQMQVTILGDTINISSWVESLTKKYKTPILISENSYYNLSIESIAELSTRQVDYIVLQEKKHHTAVYEVLTEYNETSKYQKRYADQFERALFEYNAGNLGNAKREFSKYLLSFPGFLDHQEGDCLAQLYLDRCDCFVEDYAYIRSIPDGIAKDKRWNSIARAVERFNFRDALYLAEKITSMNETQRAWISEIEKVTQEVISYNRRERRAEIDRRFSNRRL